MIPTHGYRLSPAQRSTWAGGGGWITVRLRLAAPLQRHRLQAAVDTMIARHEALRLELLRYPGVRVPLQDVAEARRTILSAYPATPADPQLAASRAAHDGELPDPPVRVELHTLPDGGEQLLIGVSALLTDPASVQLMVNDLAAAYSGADLDDDTERLQFLDISEWQYEQLAAAGEPDGRPESGVAQVTGITLPLAEPTGTESGRLHVELDAATSVALRAAAVSRGAQPETLLLSAWLLALSRHIDVDALMAAAGAHTARLLVGRYCTGRFVDGTDQIVGPLAGYLPMRVALPLPAAAKQLVDDVQALQHDQERTAHLLEPVDAAVAAGFRALAALDITPLGALGVTDADLDPPEPSGPLHLDCVIDQQIRLTVHFDRARHPDDGVARLLDSVLAIVSSLPAALTEDRPLRVLGQREQKLLTEWSTAPAGADPADAWSTHTLVELLAQGMARRDRHAEAVVAPDGVLTVEQLDRAADALAAALAGRGVAPGERVAVVAERSWRTIVAFVGILRAGAVYVPVDPVSPPQRLRALLQAVHARLVLSAGQSKQLRAVLGDEYATADIDHLSTPATTAAPTPPGPRGDSIAYVIFTSGSTGSPRPVAVSHASAVTLFHGLRRSIYGNGPAGLRVSVNAPFTFDASIKQLLQLGAGHTLCILADEVRHDGAALRAQLAQNRIDVLDITPSHLRILLAADTGATLPGRLLIGGEPIDTQLWQTLAELPGVRCWNLYGPTECTVDVSVADIRADDEPSIGRPLPGVRVWVLDAALQPVPAGAAGELCVSGAQLAHGYVGDEQETARRFVTATVASGEKVRLYRTGDRVRFLPDGRLGYLGRIDQQVKIRGFRVEPGEVEAVLRAHPGVTDAVVTARDDDGRGDQLVGYVRPAAGAVAGAAALDLARVDGINPHETRYLHDEIFTQQVYLRDGISLPDNAVVFDVGANIGMFCLFVHGVCPSARIYAFEPLAPVFAKLTHNIEAFAVPATAFHHGLSDADQEVTFTYYPGYSMMSGQASYADADAEIDVIKRFLTNERDQGLAHREELLQHADQLLADRFAATPLPGRLRRLSAVIDELGVDRIDLLKIDVQRAEADVLHGLDDRHWPLVRQLTMEVHDAPGTATEGRLQQLVALLQRHGFEVTVRQDEVLHGTDRHALSAVRPGCAATPRGTGAPSPASRPLPEQLRDWLTERLPAHLVPAHLVVLDTFPLTTNGKVDRAALPAPSGARSAGPAVAPTNRAEEILLEAVREVLTVGEIGVTDNFFALGGDSIRSIQVQVAAARRGLTFRLRDIFTHQTIRDLVENADITLTGTDIAEEADAGGTAPGHTEGARSLLLAAVDAAHLPEGVQDAYPMSALQQGMIFHSELTGDAATYHNVTVHEVAAPLEEAALAAALAQMAAAHPILRTCFDLAGHSEPLQLVHHRATIPLRLLDLRGLDAQTQRARLDEQVAEELSRPLLVNQAPLLRIGAAHTGPDTFALLISEHHAILDGWSLHLFLDELLRRYDHQRAAAAPHALTSDAAPTASLCRRFVELERTCVADDAAGRFWRDWLTGVAPLHLAAPAGGVDPADPPRLTGQLRVALPAATVQVVRDAAVRELIPFKSLLLAVHMRVLGELTGRDDVVTGLVVSGRPEQEGGDRALGLFINTVPLRATLGEASLLELGRQVWSAEQRLIEHRRYPLALIQRQLGTGPLFDVFFNFTQFHLLDEQPHGAARITASNGVTVDVAFGVAVDIEVDPRSAELTLAVQYDRRRLSDTAATRLTERYQQLLDALAHQPTAALPNTAAGGDEPAEAAEAHSAALDADGWAARLAGIWRELLGAPPHHPHAHFLHSGGSSLLALRFMALLRRRHGWAPSLAQFLADPTFAALLRHCATATGPAGRARPPQLDPPSGPSDAGQIPPAPPAAHHPLSPQQRRVYVEQHKDVAATPYTIVVGVPLPTDVDVARLAEALRVVVRRHEILRTRFVDVDGTPAQVVDAHAEPQVDLLDVAPPPLPHLAQPFDLASAPLLRAGVYREPTGATLVLQLHHIVTDGFSLRLLLTETDQIYRGIALPPVRRQYRDYAHWITAGEGRGHVQAQRSYWLDLFTPAPPSPDLPTDAPRPPVRSTQGQVLRFDIDAARTGALRAMARDRHVTLFHLLAAVYTVFLARITGGDDLVIGTPVFGRDTPGLDQVMGMFVNTVCLRNRLDPKQPFDDFVRQVAAGAAEAFGHQDYPFDELAAQIAPARDLSRNPLFDTLFALQHTELSELDFLGQRVPLAIEDSGQSMFDLDLQVYDRTATLAVHWGYSTALFRPETVQAFRDTLLDIIDTVRTDPSTPLSLFTRGHAAQAVASPDIDFDFGDGR